MIPGRADGITTLLIVCHPVAPSPSDASLYSPGTALSESYETDIIVGRITKSLKVVDRKIYDLVNNEGDLTQRLDIHTGDELEVIANNVNELLAYIRDIMINISNNAEQLSNSSQVVVDDLGKAELNITDVSATMEEMSASMEETSASIEQVGTAIASVSTAIEIIAGNADMGSEASMDVMDKADGIYNQAVIEQKDAKVRAQKMISDMNERIAKSKKVEELIQKYSLELFKYNVSDEEDENYLHNGTCM